ncbi:MAG: DUF559 domain-containing protein [Candidatus Eisenbacteria bacterium]
MSREKSGSWVGQFGKSLQDWSAKKYPRKDRLHPTALTEPIDIGNLTDYSGAGEEGRVVAAAMLAMLHQIAPRVFEDIEQMMMKCTSPIELPMLLSMAIVGRGLGNAIYYSCEGYSYGDREDISPDFLYIEPQATIGKYHVDFLLTHQSVLPDRVVETKLVVECDGHDFHDRTKEQARKDRSRDRALQSFGYKVFRYTGSEIWADVFACAQEAVGTLMADAESQWRKSRGKKGTRGLN